MNIACFEYFQVGARMREESAINNFDHIYFSWVGI